MTWPLCKRLRFFFFFSYFLFSNRLIFSFQCFCERHPSQTLVFSPRGVWATIVNLLYLIHLQDVRPPPSIPALLSVCVGLARATSCKGLSDLDDERFVWLMRLSRCIKTWWSSSHVWFCVSVSSLNGSGSRRGGPPIEHQFGWQWRPLKLLMSILVIYCLEYGQEELDSHSPPIHWQIWTSFLFSAVQSIIGWSSKHTKMFCSKILLYAFCISSLIIEIVILNN